MSGGTAVDWINRANALELRVRNLIGGRSLEISGEALDKLDPYQLRRPVGVVAGIVGWNFPLVLAASKIGPALAVGNSLVLKPSEFTSLSTVRVAQLALEAGVPEGVLNVIHGGSSVGAALSQHADVDLLSFTGSSATGKKLMIAAGQLSAPVVH